MAEVLDKHGLQLLLERQLSCTGEHRPFALHLVTIQPVGQTRSLTFSRGNTQHIKDVVSCLKAMVSSEDVIAKVSNTRVVVIQWDYVTRNGVALMADEMRSRLSSPSNAGWLNMNCAVGSVELAEAAESPFALMQQAEQALIDAHSDQAGPPISNDTGHTVADGDEIIISNILLDALEGGEFELVYQPIFLARTMKVARFEALLRWRHPTGCYVPPCNFIPAAERCGVIVNIGKWALNQACQEAKSRSAVVGVSVNASAVEFATSDFSRTVERALEQSGLNPKQITIELTESVMMSDSELVLWQLERIRDMGVHISIDDFGAGYSSLSYLHALPVDSLKLDRTFTQSMMLGERAKLVVDGILKIARDLRLTTVAEGIETRAEAEMMIEKGFTHVQGYYLGKPIPASRAFALYNATEAPTP